MQEPEERPGLPLWLPEPYHGPRPPGGFPQPRKPKKPTGPLDPAATVRVLTVIVGAVFVTVIILMTIILASGH
jgi:hypothetical protein